MLRAKIFGGKRNFFAGRTTHYSPERYKSIKKQIESWAAKKATLEQPKEFWLKIVEDWLKKIMVSKEDVVANFPRSSLGKIFSDLKGMESFGNRR